MGQKSKWKRQLMPPSNICMLRWASDSVSTRADQMYMCAQRMACKSSGCLAIQNGRRCVREYVCVCVPVCVLSAA